MPFLLLFMLTTFAFAQDRQLRDSVSRMAELEEAVRSLNEPDCSEDNQAFSKVISGITVACAAGWPLDGYEEMKVIDCTGDGKTYPGGYRFRAEAGHPHVPARSLYSDGSAPGRVIEFWSRDNALNETYLYINDTGGGPDSHDMKSVMFILPRKVIPSAKVIGNEIEMTLATGELVRFDKKTKAIKSGGALLEGPANIVPNRFRRTPPNVRYNGFGISIRLDHQAKDPTLSSETANIEQNGRTCRIPRSTLFDVNGKLKTTSDAQFVRVINQSCPATGNQPAFRI